MCEYKDNFLMGPKTALESGEWFDNFCFASNAADDDLAQLAALVGAQSTLRYSDSDQKMALADNAPALEFDLEEELARAFQTNETEHDREFSMADLGAPNFAESQQDASGSVEATSLSDTLQAQMESATLLAPTSDADPMANVDFSDMIAEELDKAMAEEVAADAEFTPSASKPAFPADDIEQELSKLMGRSVFGDNQQTAATAATAAATAASATSAPPMPTEVAEPWQSAEVVTDFPAHALSQDEVEAPPRSEYTPVQMSDFEPEVAPETPPEDHSKDQIEAVLGGAAALAAAATTSNKPVAEADTSTPMASDLAEKNADLRLRLDELDYEHGREKRRSGRRAAFAIVAVALLGGTAALGWNFAGGPTGDTPTLLASTEPVKVKPADAGGKVVPNQDQAVYKAVEVNDNSASKQQRLTDNKEQPITVAVSPTGQKTDARVARNQGDNEPLVLKPRSVRTVVVRPDGTIVSSGAPKVAPTVVSTTTVPAPNLSLQTEVQNQVAGTSATATDEAIKTAAIAAPKKVTTVPVTNLRTTEPAPAAAEATKTIAAAKPAAKPVEVAAVAPKPEPASDELPQVSSPYAVQVSSQRSAAGAKKSYATLSRRFASILDGRGVDYRQVEVKGKDYVRVRIPAKDRATANQICSQLKSAGGDCFVTR